MLFLFLIISSFIWNVTGQLVRPVIPQPLVQAFYNYSTTCPLKHNEIAFCNYHNPDEACICNYGSSSDILVSSSLLRVNVCTAALQYPCPKTNTFLAWSNMALHSSKKWKTDGKLHHQNHRQSPKTLRHWLYNSKQITECFTSICWVPKSTFYIFNFQVTKIFMFLKNISLLLQMQTFFDQKIVKKVTNVCES